MWKIINLPETDSTNKQAARLLNTENFHEKFVVITNKQTSGKGQGDTKWESQESMNLTCSLVYDVPATIEATRQFLLSQMIAVSISEFIKTQGISNITVKWPNDVYVADKKVAGLLIENIILGNHLKHSICGIGLNLNQTTFSAEIPNPISLKLLTGKHYDITDCLNSLLSIIDSKIISLETGNFQAMEKEYNELLYQKGVERQFEINNTIISGTIEGINKYGQLCLRIKGKTRLFLNAKEIKYLY